MKSDRDTVIYIVEDDEAVRDSLAAVLEAAGHQVAAFRSGREFLNAYRPGFDGCLVVDLDMPELDGPFCSSTLS